MEKQKTQIENIFFQQKCFRSETKTFASFSRVLFVKKHKENKRLCFSRFARV